MGMGFFGGWWGDDKNVLKLDSGHGCKSLTIPKKFTALYTLKLFKKKHAAVKGQDLVKITILTSLSRSFFSKTHFFNCKCNVMKKTTRIVLRHYFDLCEDTSSFSLHQKNGNTMKKANNFSIIMKSSLTSRTSKRISEVL